MVRFHHRWIKKRHKKGVHSYKHYFSSYPARLNKEIEPHENKDFELAEFKHAALKLSSRNIDNILNELDEEAALATLRLISCSKE